MDNIIEKKKKKKKSHKNEDFQSDSILNDTNSANPNVSNLETENNLETEKRKKKKKKKDKSYLDSSMDESHIEVRKEDETSMKRESSSSEASPSKKQKKTKNRESLEPVEEEKMELVEQNGQEVTHSETNEDDPTPWTREEKLELLSKIQNEELTKNEVCSFRSTLASPAWNWGSVCIENRSPKDCEATFSFIITKVQKVKTLKQIIESAVLLTENGGKRGMKKETALNIFVKEYAKKNKGHRNTDVPSICKVWKELPEEEKEKYHVLAKKSNVVSKPKPPTRARAPFDIFYHEKIEGGGSKNKEQRAIYKKKYEELKLKKKLKYIELSFKEIFEYEKRAQEHKERCPDWTGMKKSLVNKDNLELYLHILHEMPKQPPLQANHSFYRDMLESGKLDDIPGKEKLTSALKLYAQLSENEKVTLQESTKQKVNKYHKKYAEWRKQQDEIVGTFADRYYKPEKPAKEIKQKQPKMKKNNIGKGPAFQNMVATSMARPKFANEPKPPPATVYKLFAVHYQESKANTKFPSTKEKLQAINKAWFDLKDDQKEIFQKRCEELKNKYSRRLLEYVSGLEKHERKTYLGYHRAHHSNYFKTDIFEKFYPNAKYPVYITSPAKKKPKSSVSEMKSDGEEENTKLKKGQEKMTPQRLPKSPLDHLVDGCTSSEDEETIEEETNKLTDSDSTSSDEDDSEKEVPTKQGSESDSDDDDDDNDSKHENESDSDEDENGSHPSASHRPPPSEFQSHIPQPLTESDEDESKEESDSDEDESEEENDSDEDVEIKKDDSDSDEDVEINKQDESDSDEDDPVQPDNKSDSDEDDNIDAANISKAWEVKKTPIKREESNSSSDDSD